MATESNETKSSYPLPDEPPPPYPGTPDQPLPPGLYPPQYAPPSGDYSYPPSEQACGPPSYPPPTGDWASYPPPPHAYTDYHGWKSGEGARYPQREYIAPPVVITSQPLESNTVFITHDRKPSNYLALSIVTCLCFSPLCGLIALCFSVMSQNSYIRGDVEGASKNGKIALALCVAGIVFSTIILVIMFSSGQTHFST